MQVYESRGIARKEAMKLVAKDRGIIKRMCIRRCFRRVKMKKIPMILLARIHAIGCDRPEMIYSFNHVEEASVDNEVKIQKAWITFRQRQNRLWILQPRSRKSQMCIQVRP